MVVRDGDAGGGFDDVDHAVGAIPHGVMVDPDVGWAEDGDSIAVTSGSFAKVYERIPNISPFFGNNVVNVEAVYDDIRDELDGNPGAISDMDIHSPAVDSFIAGHYQLLL